MLCNPNPKQGGSTEAFKQRNSISDLCFSELALPLEEWSELHLTPPGQQQLKSWGVTGHCGHYSNKSLQCIWGKLRMQRHQSTGSLALCGELAFRKLTPGTQASPERKVVPSFNPPAGRLTLWPSPHFFRLLTAEPIDTEKPSPHREVQGEGIQTAQTLSTGKGLLCEE